MGGAEDGPHAAAGHPTNRHANGGVEEKMDELRRQLGNVQVRIWRRPDCAVDRATAEHLFEVINAREDVLRRLIRRRAYFKYVEGRFGYRKLYADEILRDGFCLNMIDTPFYLVKVVTNLKGAHLGSRHCHQRAALHGDLAVFGEIRNWKERITAPVIISLAKGVEASYLHVDPGSTCK